MPDGPLRLGIDVGGTFVDCAVLSGGRIVALGKSPTRPDDPTASVLESIAAGAASLGLADRDLLARVDEIAHGTTLGLNALLTRSGTPVGLLATLGHEDALPIGRVHQKVAGLGADELLRVAELAKPEPLVPRRRIYGIHERVDATGAELVALDVAGVARAVEALADDGCESLAIAFLWSFRNPDHERRAGEIARHVRPTLGISLSSDVAPVLGEYERTAATVVNAYLAKVQQGYLERLSAALAERGFRGRLGVLLSSGAIVPARTAGSLPVQTLRSGPVGGAIAVAWLGRRLGVTNLLATDVGGTSFDVALVVDGRPEQSDVTVAARLHLATPSIDVVSIGAGGGSIAWLDNDGGVHVGPRSAGAAPGPACYGRGGTEPTVTDADLVLGRLNPGAVLGGRIPLDRAAAERAIGRLARVTGVDVPAMAAGLVRVADASMADLVRRVTVERGHDPRRLVLVAYGGAAGLHAGSYAIDAGAREVVLPLGASLFSAFGLALAEAGRTYQRSGPLVAPLDPAVVRAVFGAMARAARADLGGADVDLRREIDFRYRRQTHRLAVALDPGAIRAGLLERAVARFEADYELVYGPGTAYCAAGIEATAFRLVAIVPRRDGDAGADPVRSARARPAYASGSRPVYFDRWVDRTPIFDGTAVRPGHTLRGPAVVDWPTTGLLVHPGQRVTFDRLGHAHLVAET